MNIDTKRAQELLTELNAVMDAVTVRLFAYNRITRVRNSGTALIAFEGDKCVERMCGDGSNEPDRAACVRFYKHSPEYDEITEAEYNAKHAEIRKANESEPERNDDGDTIEDMRKVQDELGKGSVECESQVFGKGPSVSIYKASGLWEFTDTAKDYRITAKHADTFDAGCMQFETWARAAIGRGLLVIKRGVSGDLNTYDRCGVWGISAIGGGGMQYKYASTRCVTWTAITRAAYEQETKPQEPTITKVLCETSDGLRKWIDIAKVKEATKCKQKSRR